jgi:hypothetical protein
MPYFLTALALIVAAFAICRYYWSKTRLVEKEIEKVIARKFASGEHGVMIAKLREDNAIMRNLLLDLVENEAVSTPTAFSADRAQVRDSKIQRYREILAETVSFLQRDANAVRKRTSIPMAAKSAKP